MAAKITSKIKEITKSEKNKEILKNIKASFVVKGLSIILVLFTTPAYMRYFNNNVALGVWFTVVSIINWILMFDLGIGNGLRNKLPKAIEDDDKDEQRTLLSSAYISIVVIGAIFLAILLIINSYLDWNSILNVEESVLSAGCLKVSMAILAAGIVFRLVFNLNSGVFFALQKSAVTSLMGFLSTLVIFVYVSIASAGDANSSFVKLSIANAVLSNVPLLIGTFYIFLVPFKGMWPKIKYFNKKRAIEILKIGTVLLWLQVIFCIIASTHAFLITSFRGPEEVVEYNIYYRIFYGLLSVFYLFLTPIWSAVTKAQARKDFAWIRKAYKFLLLSVIPFTIINIATIPFLQPFFNIWLKENTIPLNVWYVLAFAFFNLCFAIHNVNTSIFNGLSDFKIQTIFVTIAAVLMIPVCYFLTVWLGNWSGVIIGSALCVVPYQIIQIIFGFKKLRQLELGNLDSPKNIKNKLCKNGAKNNC